MVPVHFILLPEVVLLDVAGPAEAFRLAEQRQPGSFALHFHAVAPELRSASGLSLGRLLPLPDVLDSGAIVVLAGVSGPQADADPAAATTVSRWLRTNYRPEGMQVMAVCAGALITAAAGLLDGRACTTHHACIAQLSTLAPTAAVQENRIFVEDGNVLTSAGITAGIDLALELVSRHGGPRLACDVARDMVVYLRRAGQDPALSPWLAHRNHVHPLVHRVQDAIVRKPAAAWTTERLADLAHTSPRHLSRLFGEHAQCTPLTYLHQVRLALARQLLSDASASIETVAERTGYGSARQLRRVWQRFEPASPTALRQAAQRPLRAN